MDLQSPAFVKYVMIGSIAFAFLVIILYYFPGGKIKVPAIAIAALTCLIAGAAIGVLALYSLGYHWEREIAIRSDSPFGTGGGPPNIGGGRGGGPGAAVSRGNGPGREAARSGGPNSKTQLATLVTKLDVLTRKPLTFNLNGEQKTKIRDRLKGLEDHEEIGEEDAKKTLDALLDIVKENKETLEAVGFRWPGQPATAPPPPIDIPNPFKEKAAAEHLKSLRSQLSPGGDK